MRLVPIVFLLLAGTANAEVFKCKAGISWAGISLEYGDEIVVTATGDADNDSGTIEVAGTVHDAEYSVQGFNRRWDFGPLTERGAPSPSYAFIIEPSGEGSYVDFSFADEDGRVNAEQSFICVKGQAEIDAESNRLDAMPTEIERQRLENERLRREADAANQAEIDAESNRLDPMAMTAESAYIFVIQQKVERNWVRPPTAAAGIECIVNVRQLPGGEVVSVTIGSCNGDAVVRRSIEAAVHRASPLPSPADPSVFNRNLQLEFRPAD